MVDGLTRETAIKILPPEDPAKVRFMREASREALRRWKPELMAILAGTGPVEVNRALDAMVAEGMKTEYHSLAERVP